MRVGLYLFAGVLALGALAALRAPVPVQADSSPVRRGAELFATRGCAHCHGDAGLGGPIGPDLSDVGKRRTAAEIERQIRLGGHGMPPYGDQLKNPEIADLLAYLRSNRGQAKP